MKVSFTQILTLPHESISVTQVFLKLGWVPPALTYTGPMAAAAQRFTASIKDQYGLSGLWCRSPRLWLAGRDRRRPAARITVQLGLSGEDPVTLIRAPSTVPSPAYASKKANHPRVGSLSISTPAGYQLSLLRSSAPYHPNALTFLARSWMATNLYDLVLSRRRIRH